MAGPREEKGHERCCQTRLGLLLFGIPAPHASAGLWGVQQVPRSDSSRVLAREVTLADPGCGSERPADPEGLWLWNRTSLLGMS